MDKKILAQMEDNQKARVAVAYLILNPDLRPKEMEKLFAKLDKYETSMTQMTNTLEEARQSAKLIYDQIQKLSGSVESVVDLIAEDLPAEKIVDYCEKYNPEAMEAAAMAGSGHMHKAGDKSVAGEAGMKGAVPSPQPVTAPPGVGPDGK